MTALQWITKEAKHLRRKYPHRFKTWREYVAQASAIYAAKHKGKSPVGKKRKRKVASVKFIEHGETTRAKPAHTYRVNRTKSGRFKSYTKISGRRKRKVGADIQTKSRTHTDYNRNKVNITVGRVRRKRSYSKPARASRPRRVGASSPMQNLLPIVGIAAVGLAAYLLLRKPSTTYPGQVSYVPTGNYQRDQSASNILAYATAAGLTITAISNLINALNSKSDSEIVTASQSIDAGGGLPAGWLA